MVMNLILVFLVCQCNEYVIPKSMSRKDLGYKKNIKHPCNPIPVYCCISIAILQLGGAHNFMGKVYTRYIPGIEWHFI